MIRSVDPEYDNPPFAPEPACPACGKPWADHPGVAKSCESLQTALLALKAAAVQTYAIHDTLRRIIERIEGPETPTSPNPKISDLLDDMEL
jgi:hypothetical protein